MSDAKKTRSVHFIYAYNIPLSHGSNLNVYILVFRGNLCAHDTNKFVYQPRKYHVNRCWAKKVEQKTFHSFTCTQKNSTVGQNARKLKLNQRKYFTQFILRGFSLSRILLIVFSHILKMKHLQLRSCWMSFSQKSSQII